MRDSGAGFQVPHPRLVRIEPARDPLPWGLNPDSPSCRKVPPELPTGHREEGREEAHSPRLRGPTRHGTPIYEHRSRP